MGRKCSSIRAVRAATILSLALTLPACNVFFPPDPVPAPAASVALPGPTDGHPLRAAESAPRILPGLGALDLDTRESRVFWNMASQLYAPCPSEAVSIVQCIEETRPCAACVPAARLLAEKIKAGATPDQARDMYGMRFGPNVKQVDVADSPTRGPEGAPVTIVVWSDFECPHCRHAMPFLEHAVEKHAPRVRLVHKFYPLSQHTHAAQAARAAIAAQNQGKYWEMERTLFDHQRALEDSDIDGYADELKLDMKRFHADMTAERTTKILERDHADAEHAGLSGTPFILVNGRDFDGSYFHVESDLEPWIKLELELAGKR
jgi:protein-disulfide isomerase